MQTELNLCCRRHTSTAFCRKSGSSIWNYRCKTRANY